MISLQNCLAKWTVISSIPKTGDSTIGIHPQTGKYYVHSQHALIERFKRRYISCIDRRTVLDSISNLLTETVDLTNIIYEAIHDVRNIVYITQIENLSKTRKENKLEDIHTHSIDFERAEKIQEKIKILVETENLYHRVTHDGLNHTKTAYQYDGEYQNQLDVILSKINHARDILSNRILFLYQEGFPRASSTLITSPIISTSTTTNHKSTKSTNSTNSTPIVVSTTPESLNIQTIPDHSTTSISSTEAVNPSHNTSCHDQLYTYEAKEFV